MNIFDVMEDEVAKYKAAFAETNSTISVKYEFFVIAAKIFWLVKRLSLTCGMQARRL